MENATIKEPGNESLLELYEKAILKNSKAISRAEQFTKWLILMVPSKIGFKSKSSAQGAYSVVNLLGLYHKLITLKYQTRMRSQSPLKSGPISPYLSGITPHHIRPLTMASIIEYTALFAELYAFKKGGEGGRMAAIWTVEALRALVQMRIFYLNKYDIVTRHQFADISSAKRPPPRQVSMSGAQAKKKPVAVTYDESMYWACDDKRSQRKVPILRSFAEVLHIIRPLLTLVLMKRFGKKSWVVLAFSLFVDVFSQAAHMSFWKHLGKDAKGELSRRNNLFALYLLWTPLYEVIFRNKASSWVYLKLTKVPVVKNIASKYYCYNSFLLIILFLFYRIP